MKETTPTPTAQAESSSGSELALGNTENLDKLSSLAAEYNVAISEHSQNEFRLMAITAKAMALMKKALTPEIIKALKSLENTKLGFRTDKPDGGYDEETIRSVAIEVVLRGVKILGNEFNIIAGNLYITKEGFEGKMDRDPRFNRVRVLPGIPVWEEKQGRAIVPFESTWEFRGKEMDLKGDVSVRIQKGSTDDQILGKAERKIRARIWSVATGEKLPDGDLGDGDVHSLADAKPANAKTVGAPTVHRPSLGKTKDAASKDAPKGDSAPDDVPPEAPTNAKAQLQQLRRDCSFTEYSVMACLRRLGITNESRDIDELTNEQAALAVSRWAEIQQALD